MFTKEEIQQIVYHGIPVEKAEKQIEFFTTGFPSLTLLRPAKTGDGIIRFSEHQAEHFAALFDANASRMNMMKFVPASGAATRMFKQLYAFHEALKMKSFRDIMNDDTYKDALTFFQHIDDFAFWPLLKDVLQKHSIPSHVPLSHEHYSDVLKLLLFAGGLNFSEMPKALIPFHQYDISYRYAFEEHLVEGVTYAKGLDNKVEVHFTLPLGVDELIRKKREPLQNSLAEKHNAKIMVSCSVQHSSTDTIAVTLNNKPFYDKNNRLCFRPGGHGALIHNLNQQDADIVFIKNIDNVVREDELALTVFYKKVLAGYLIDVRKRIFAYLDAMAHDDLSQFQEMKSFVREVFGVDCTLLNCTKEWMYDFLNRPLRVCGMVKNEGEPGGGPFWVMDDKYNESLQIVESAQIDKSDTKQMTIARQATHFNPVDLVCAIRDYKGEKFNLHHYVDHKTGFIAEKSIEGKPIRALELPGLWNGAMANWLTIFVEVPVDTFNPVKTVNDLLRKAHIVKH